MKKMKDTFATLVTMYIENEAVIRRFLLEKIVIGFLALVGMLLLNRCIAFIGHEIRFVYVFSDIFESMLRNGRL